MRTHGRYVIGGLVGAVVLLGAVAGTAWASPAPPGSPPWAPGPGGPDVVHTMTGKGKPTGGGGTSPLLSYRGGAVQTAPAAYLVFWGSQWTNNDRMGEAAYLQGFLSGLSSSGGGGDTWSTSTTQYCQGVATGSTNCNAASTANRITHPTTSPLIGVLSDTAVVAPTRPKQSQIAAEAVRAAGIFQAQNPTVFNPRAQFVIATAHNNNATGFGSSYCAWHSSTSSSFGNLAYTNLPYIPDAGASCGANFVNANGPLDGVSIVEGHEYAETITDPFPSSGWLDANGAENGDKCAWIRSGQGAAANVSVVGAAFPVQSLWSNNFNGTGGCVIRYTSATNQG